VTLSVCFELVREMMRNSGARPGEVSWCTTCFPTRPTPMMATEQTMLQGVIYCQLQCTECVLAVPGAYVER
jgi:hypothetical protein